MTIDSRGPNEDKSSESLTHNFIKSYKFFNLGANVTWVVFKMSPQRLQLLYGNKHGELLTGMINVSRKRKAAACIVNVFVKRG